MLYAAHILLMSLYLVLPPVGLILVASRRLRNATVAIASALLLGIAASVIYGVWLGGIVGPMQVLLTCYWAAGLVCILKLLDFGIDLLARTAFALGGNTWKRRQRQTAAQVARVVLLFLIGLPYMIVAAATYRPRTMPEQESGWYDLGASNVTFESTDGLKISGLWITAPPQSSGEIPIGRWGKQTLLICPGTRGEKGSYEVLARAFLGAGYNVLSFDFRGHEGSEGQIVSFGDLERRDVLGAVRWLRENQSIGSRRIVGVGIDTGAAALLAAASDPSREGHDLKAVAVFGCFDSFTSLGGEVADISFPPPLQWLIVPVALPLACVQTGADLWDFSPADAAEKIAPRPILFVHGERDLVITFEHGVDLYDAASAPKSHIWLDDMTDDQAIGDRGIVSQVRHFLDTAVPML